jgi:hypothetical protein
LPRSSVCVYRNSPFSCVCMYIYIFNFQVFANTQWSSLANR